MKALWRLRLSFVLGLAVAYAVPGCSRGKTPKTEGPDQHGRAADRRTGKTAKTATSPLTPEPAPSQPPAGVVLLGSPDLTAGIPGAGPLSVDEIQAWLELPRNHQTLAVQLPFGLSLGAKQITGLDKNPLTRAKIELGRQLYFDTRLSADNTVSCASCHDPGEGYGRHTQFGVGINGQQGNRNSPVSYNRILSGPQFWDGRASSLEEQAKGPIANPIEMGNTHEKAVATVQGIEGYRIQFENIFPQEGVTIDSIAQAIASFERVLVTGPAPADYYEKLMPFLKLDKADIEDVKQAYAQALANHKAHPMSASAIRGRELFFGKKAECTTCHVGANFTDEKYHNLGVGMDKPMPDLGRFDVTGNDKEKGAFKTPTIRNVALSAPYMHDGSQKTLEEVVEWYARGGHKNPYLSDKIKKLDLTPQDKKDLVEFMKACTGSFPKVESGRLPQ